MKIDEYLRSTRELSVLTTQNGWIDNDTLALDVLDRSGHTVDAAVTFEEIVMEGAGCVADRVSCYGRVRLHLDGNGEVRGMEILQGAPGG